MKHQCVIIGVAKQFKAKVTIISCWIYQGLGLHYVIDKVAIFDSEWAEHSKTQLQRQKKTLDRQWIGIKTLVLIQVQTCAYWVSLDNLHCLYFLVAPAIKIEVIYLSNIYFIEVVLESAWFEK
jgi:hypothetical protein